MKQKKILAIIIVIFTLILGGLFFVYQSFIADDRSGGILGITTGKGRDTLFPSFPLLGGDKSRSVDTQEKVEGVVPTLRQISSIPVAGGIVFNTEENTVIRYIERATGHVFETTKDSLEQRRISNTTIPRIQKSVWSPNGDAVILQYLNESEILKSFYGKMSSDVGSLDGWFLSNNVTGIDVHEDGDMFYIQKIGNNTKGFISNFDGTNSEQVFSSKIYDLIPLWIGDSVGVVSKASNNLSGFLYRLQSGNRIKLVSSDGLLVKISPDGTKVLFSTSDTRRTNLFVHDLALKKTTGLPFTTLADKCTWTNNVTLFCAAPYNITAGVLPDDWYKGTLSFSDDIWSYDTEIETTQLVYNAEAGEKTFDITELTIDSEQKILLFTNKNDLTLWALSLESGK